MYQMELETNVKEIPKQAGHDKVPKRAFQTSGGGLHNSTSMQVKRAIEKRFEIMMKLGLLSGDK
jgi:hypothetical protein